MVLRIFPLAYEKIHIQIQYPIFGGKINKVRSLIMFTSKKDKLVYSNEDIENIRKNIYRFSNRHVVSPG